MNVATRQPAGGLYLVTPDEPDTQQLLKMVAPLLGEGIAMLQLRNKAAAPALLREQALALLPLARDAGTPLVINDDWSLAADIGADGAHLGRTDGALGHARIAMGPLAVLGATCHDDLDLAVAAAAAGASYVAFGAMFESGTKPQAPRSSLAVLGNARALGLSAVAIGGITPDNAGMLRDAGADFIAVLGAVFAAPDPAMACRALVRIFPKRLQ